MMEHYISIKKQNPDAYVFYRLGDFYEMFFDDAKEVSKLLDLTLTGRDCGLTDRAPMCGVPHHSVDTYISKLMKLGKKVAICEQLSLPQDQKGMVKRDVVRVVTPGTIIENELLDGGTNNYLCAVYIKNNNAGLSWIDISTGELNVLELKGNARECLEEYLMSTHPSELIAPTPTTDYLNTLSSVKAGNLTKPYAYYDFSFATENAKRTILRFYNIINLQALGIENCPCVISALGGLLKYIEETQKRTLSHVLAPNIIDTDKCMFLDNATRRNLELLETISERSLKGSLFDVINLTKTNMGERLLRKWLCEPLRDSLDINYRLSAVDDLKASSIMRKQIGEYLSNIRDIERLSGKVACSNINPRDVRSIMVSLNQLLPIKGCITKMASSEYLCKLSDMLNPLPNIISLIDSAIVDSPPTTIKDGGIIKAGYNAQLDEYRNSQSEGKTWLSDFELKERESTGIRTLKIGFNKVFGYYVEVSSSFTSKVPDRYIRKQTLVGGERYTSQELKIIEERILGAEEKAIRLEETLYNEIKSKIADVIETLLLNAKAISELDVIYSFAMCAIKHSYCKPNISDKVKVINIKEGRHPVVETLNMGNIFVPNDTVIDNDSKTLIITGPNMAGKSTYMRQSAIIVLLAHIGSFVPAKSADIALTDRIFTRIGASDNLAYGQSTFMIEMTELANILNNATENSLLILDEIGRGTSTLDGLAIAFACAEYISVKIKARTLFATHYHELSELESLFQGIKNYHVLIRECEDKITFLYKIARGSTGRSFGIEVASIAGINKKVIERSKEIMSSLDETHAIGRNIKDFEKDSQTKKEDEMPEIFNESIGELLDIINFVDLDNYTPIQAITLLMELKAKAKKINFKKQTRGNNEN
jgi:DNA mismatch repair protein MutS